MLICPPTEAARRADALSVAKSEFNCSGAYSDASPEDCAKLRFLKTKGYELKRAFKVPTLRNIADEVLTHYNAAPAGHSDLVPLNLSEKQLGQLEAF